MSFYVDAPTSLSVNYLASLAERSCFDVMEAGICGTANEKVSTAYTRLVRKRLTNSVFM